MQPTTPSGDSRATLFPRRNLILFGAAVATIGVGYLLLNGEKPEPASVLLVVGYCVLLPLSLIA